MEANPAGIQDTQAQKKCISSENFHCQQFLKNSQDKWVFTYRTKGSIIFQTLSCLPQEAKKIVMHLASWSNLKKSSDPLMKSPNFFLPFNKCIFSLQSSIQPVG